MSRQFTDSEAQKHNKLWNEANRLTSGELHFDGEAVPGPPDFGTRQKLKKAMRLYKSVLTINPENGAAYFFIARIEFRLGEKGKCLENLLRAQEWMPESPGVARESVLVAMLLNQLEKAIEIGQAAVKRFPVDGGVFVNLGLALLCSGRAEEAARAFDRGTELEPNNTVTTKLSVLAKEVAAGNVECPRSEREIALAIQA